MQVRYTAGAAALVIAQTGDVVKRGDAVTVPNDIGTQLVAQGWEQITDTKTATKKTTTKEQE